MAKIKPFYGYRYNTDIVKNLSDVMAPPYDSLSDEQTDSCYDLNPYNAARLISQRSYDTDDAHNNCYTRSRDYLQSWIENGVLVKENEKAIYVYEQTITVNREKYYNRGIIALLELTNYSDGIVVPCEDPSTDSKNDRYRMISETESNNSLISCMYTDGDKRLSAMLTDISEKDADMSFTTGRGNIENKLWAVTDEKIIALAQSALADKKMFIVDGHNRYEACYEYKMHKMKEKGYTGKESFNYVMALISDSKEDGRVHLPVHRLLHMSKPVNEAYIIAGLQDNFTVEKIIVDKLDDDMASTIKKQISTQKRQTIFALYTGSDYFYRFKFKGENYLKTVLPDVSEAYRSIDLVILNKLVFEEQMNINPENDARIEYTRNVREAMKIVDGSDNYCLFVLNPINAWQLEALSKAGERLPKRSVSIFPKPATGIVIHKFTDEV